MHNWVLREEITLLQREALMYYIQAAGIDIYYNTLNHSSMKDYPYMFYDKNYSGDYQVLSSTCWKSMVDDRKCIPYKYECLMQMLKTHIENQIKHDEQVSQGSQSL